MTIDDIFSYVSQKTGFDISCKLPPMEIVNIKCQDLFSGKNKKNISMCRLLKILPRVSQALTIYYNESRFDNTLHLSHKLYIHIADNSSMNKFPKKQMGFSLMSFLHN